MYFERYFLAIILFYRVTKTICSQSTNAMAEIVKCSPNRRLSLLYVDPRAHKDEKYRYYYDYVQQLQELHQTFIFRPSGQSDNPFEHQTIRDQHFDAIIIGFGMFDINNGTKADDITPWVSQVNNTPVVAMFNKEYQELNQKLSWTKTFRTKLLCAFSVHHNISIYMENTGVHFARLPFAVDSQLFDLRVLNAQNEYLYDFGFTGIIRPQQANNFRSKIMYQLKVNLERVGIRVFHAEWLELEEYRKVMAQTKIWLTTTSIADIVNPRYFEVMASNTTMLLCDRVASPYSSMGFEDGVNLAMFDNLQEAYDKIIFFTQNEKERNRIIDRARAHALHHHTYALRARQWTDIVAPKICVFTNDNRSQTKCSD